MVDSLDNNDNNNFILASKLLVSAQSDVLINFLLIMKKRVVSTAFLALFGLSTFLTTSANANPYKVVWQRCSPGSEVEMVISCRLVGGEECFANWQGHCDEPASLG
jgi:hypothetical protein